MKIKKLIEEKVGLISYRQFEKESGLSRITIMNIMNDKHKPTVLTIKKICNYFGVDYHEYLD